MFSMRVYNPCFLSFNGGVRDLGGESGQYGQGQRA